LVRRNEKMRSEEEIKGMMKRIDEVVDIKDPENYDKLYSDKDFIYCLDIKAALQWLLGKISTGQERIEIEKEMRDITEIDREEADVDELKKYIEFFGQFRRDFKNRYHDDIYNIVDAFDWVLREESTENFLSDSYMDLEALRKKVSGEVPIHISRTEGKKVIPLRDITPEEKEKLLGTIDHIAKLRERRHENSEKEREIDDEQTIIRAMHLKDISMAKDNKGKKIYPNDTLRYSELNLRLQKDEKYQGSRKKYKKLKNERVRLRIECNRLVDRKAILMGFFLEDDKRVFY